MDSIWKGMGRTFSAEIARRGGKNELSAHLEVLLLTLHMGRGGQSHQVFPDLQASNRCISGETETEAGRFRF